MSSATIITCISSALHDSQWLLDADHDQSQYFLELNIDLRYLKTFLLCGKKLRNDENFKHFLVEIGEKVQITAEQLHGFCQAEADESDDYEALESFRKLTFSLVEEMGRWYVTMLDSSFTLNLMSANEIMEIITSNLEIIFSNWPEEIDPLKVQLRFLKSLIHFVSKGNTEASKDLLAHSETIAINIAYALFRMMYRYHDDSIANIFEEMVKTRPIDPQVYEIYIQSLSGSKLPGQSLDEDDLLAVKNFLYDIMSTLAEIICVDTCHVSLMKDQLEELYESLRSLRIVFEQLQMANFEMEIVDVITDAGIIICSIIRGQIEVNIGHQYILEKVEIILSKIAEMDPQKPILTFPRTSSYGFVDCILEKLMELTCIEGEATAKSHFQAIQEELASIRSFLGEVVELRDEQMELQALWD